MWTQVAKGEPARLTQKRAVETGPQGGSGGGLGDFPAATVSLCDGMFASAEGLVSDRGDQSDQE